MDSYAKEVIYHHEHWMLLEEKRVKGLKIINALDNCGYISSILHGSVARGDISRDSDIDIALLHPASIGMIKFCLENIGYKVYDIKLVQPTPRHTPKVYIYVDPYEEQSISIPLSEPESIEIDYYRFSGFVTKNDIIIRRRVKGVNKKLMLVLPTEKGHIEIPVIGNEGYVSRMLGISIDTVKDRVEALRKRVEEGHTGLFIDISIPIFEEVEHYIKKLCRENISFRRVVAKHGLCT